MEKISKAEAISRGLRWYFTGAECPKGHPKEVSVKRGTCRECDRVPSANFAARNRDKIRAANRRRWAENREAMNAAMKRHRHRREGIPPAPYPAPSRCENCQERPSKRSLCIDRCHVTGKFRGWLCAQCNLGIGNFIDSPVLLRAAAEYLEQRQVSFLLPKVKSK